MRQGSAEAVTRRRRKKLVVVTRLRFPGAHAPASTYQMHRVETHPRQQSLALPFQLHGLGIGNRGSMKTLSKLLPLAGFCKGAYQKG